MKAPKAAETAATTLTNLTADSAFRTLVAERPEVVTLLNTLVMALAPGYELLTMSTPTGDLAGFATRLSPNAKPSTTAPSADEQPEE